VIQIVNYGERSFLWRLRRGAPDASKGRPSQVAREIAYSLRFLHVDLLFGPDDEESFFAISDRLTRQFESTLTDKELGWVASQVMNFKWSFLDGDLGKWSRSDITEILFELYPRKVVLDVVEFGEVIDGFSLFLQFLAAESILEMATSRTLCELIQSSRSQFVTAMSNEQLFGMGKRLATAMADDGVDISDRSALDRWMADFNDRSMGDRDRILGPSIAGEYTRSRSTPPPMPPVILASEQELESLARDAVTFRRVSGLLDFIGEGKKVTQKGNLTLADGKALAVLLETNDLEPWHGNRQLNLRSSTELVEVDWVYALAVAAGLLDRKVTKVSCRVTSREIEVTPLPTVERLLRVVLNDFGPTAHYYPVDHYGFAWYANDLDESLGLLLEELYRERDPHDIEDLTDAFWFHLEQSYQLDGLDESRRSFHYELVEYALRRALRRLSELGVVRVSHVTRQTEQYRTEESGGDVSLTALGLWFVQRYVAEFTSAPIVGVLATLEAAELLGRIVDMAEDIGDAEIDVWLDRRGAVGASLLLVALPASSDVVHGAVFRALLRLGPVALDAVSMLDGSEEFGAFTEIFRFETGLLDDIDWHGDAVRFIKSLRVVKLAWGDGAVSPWAVTFAGDDGVEFALRDAWRVNEPDTDVILAILGDTFPDKVIAKAARKSLFKYRTRSK
jgi:hypothetical protein